MSAITFEALAGKLGIDVSEWKRGLSNAGQAMKAFENGVRAMSAQAGQAVKQLANSFSIAAAAATAAAAASVKASADFEQSMARVKALLSGGIDDANELEKAYQSLAAQAKQLGADTVFTSQQAADAMSYFAKSGFSAKEIYDAMPATLALAASGAIDIGQAADISSKILRGMGLETSQLNHAVDVLAKAFTTANTDLSQLGEAMKYVGPIANVAGLSLEATVAPLQLMGDAGIQASMAGTSLRGILGDLAKGGTEVSKAFARLGVEWKNQDGSMRPLADIVDDFNERLKVTGLRADDLSLSAFGERAGPGFAVLLEKGGQALRDYEIRLQNAGGTAARIAKIQQDTLGQSFERLTGQVDSLRLGIGEKLGPSLRSLTERATAWLEINSRLITSRVGDFWAALVRHVSSVADSFQRLWVIVQPVLSGMADRLSALKAKAAELFDSLPQWAKDLILVGGSLTGISIALGAVGGMIPIFGGMFSAIAMLLNPVGLLTGGIVFLKSAFVTVGAAIAMVFSPTGAIVLGVTAVVGAVAAAVAYAVQKSEYAREVFNRISSRMAEAFMLVKAKVLELKTQALDIFSAWWKENGPQIERMAVKLGTTILEMADFWMEKLKPAFVWFVEFAKAYLLTKLKQVLDAFAFLSRGIEAVADMLHGDFRRAGNLALEVLADLTRAAATALEAIDNLWHKIPLIGLSKGQGMYEQIANLRKYADGLDTARKASTALLDAEAAANDKRNEIALAREERERLEKLALAKADAKSKAPSPVRVAAATPAADKMAGGQGGDTILGSMGGGSEADRLHFGLPPLDPPKATGTMGGGSAEQREKLGLPPLDAPTAVPTAAPPVAAKPVGWDSIANPENARKFGEKYGAVLGKATREQALKIFTQLGPELERALEPDESGVISMGKASEVLNQYHAIFARIPGFSNEAFIKMQQQAVEAMKGVTTSSGQMVTFYLDQLQAAVDVGDKVFIDAGKQREAEVKRLMTVSANAYQEEIALAAAFSKAEVEEAKTRENVTTEELRQLVTMRQNVLDAMKAVKDSHGAAREAAIENLRATREAYDKTYKEIGETVKKGAEDTAKSIRSRAEEKAAERRKTLAERRAGDAGGPSLGQQMMDGIASVGAGLSNAFTGALTSAFSGGTGKGLGDLLAQTADPVRKLEIQIKNLKAQLTGAALNTSNVGVVNGTGVLTAELSRLQQRLMIEQGKQAAQRESARQAHNAEYQRREQQKVEAEREARREQNLDFAGMVSVGSVPPMQVTIQANDARHIADELEKIWRRRGRNVGPTAVGKRGIQSR